MDPHDHSPVHTGRTAGPSPTPALRDAALAPACPNCGVPGTTRWCGTCGQWNASGPGALREAFRIQWQRVRHSVVALLIRPGLLTAEYRDGRRARAIAPWRLALNAISIFFVLAVVTGFSALGTTPDDIRTAVGADVERLVEASRLPRSVVVERIERRFNTTYTVLMAVSWLSYLLLAAGTHPRSRQGWMVHAVFAMHLMAFIFIGSLLVFGLVRLLTLVLALGPPAAASLRIWATFAFLLVFAGHVIAAFRRVYADRPLAALLKGIVVVLAGNAVDGSLFKMALGITIASL